ncbi:MAG: ATP-binding cassette domain-containing protein [Candidatus Omnitrophica bacterium]|nr:ATP-binding cassette domain-containing protein [Candidatus Omnitrophota bacterium]
MKETIVINLSRITVRRGGRVVLKDLDWTTRRGEHWFIMGQNGSGKTTLTELLLGYLWASEGQVEVLGRQFGRASLPELRRFTGYVAPWIFRRMPPETPVEDAVASGWDASVGRYGCISPALRRSVTRWLNFFGCRGLKKRLFGELSSGQQLKVVLARALVHNPALVILDEPFSLLDLGARVRMYRYLEKLALRKDAPQFVMVTHHREDVLPFFNQGLLLKGGKVEFAGERTAALAPARIAAVIGIDKVTAERYFV